MSSIPTQRRVRRRVIFLVLALSASSYFFSTPTDAFAYVSSGKTIEQVQVDSYSFDNDGTVIGVQSVFASRGGKEYIYRFADGSGKRPKVGRKFWALMSTLDVSDRDRMYDSHYEITVYEWSYNLDGHIKQLKEEREAERDKVLAAQGERILRITGILLLLTFFVNAKQSE